MTSFQKGKEDWGRIPNVYTYANIPQHLTVQIVHIIQDCIGWVKDYHHDFGGEAYEFIFKTLCRESGKFELNSNAPRESYIERFLNFLLNTKSTAEVLDVVELTFKYIGRVIRGKYDNH